MNQTLQLVINTLNQIEVSPVYDGGHVVGSTVRISYDRGSASSFTSTNTTITATNTWTA